MTILGWVGLLAACGAGGSGSAVVAVASPTLSPYFASTEDVLPSSPETTAGPPTAAPYFGLTTTHPWPTRTRRPTLTPAPTRTPVSGNALATATPETQADPYSEVFIYDDELAEGWSLEYSEAVSYDLEDTTYVYAGTVAAAITQRDDYGSFFFTVRDDAPEAYPYDRVLGVRFWLNSGATALAPADLAVTVIGSNAHTAYVPGDDSVDLDELSFFSETRLYYLGVNQSLPPETWVEIVVWLDDLPFEPDYAYITGVYLKNDEGTRNTFFVDNVALLLTREGD